MRKALQLMTAASAAAVLAFVVSTVGCGGTVPGGPDAGDGGPCGKDPFSAECKCAKPAECDPLHQENRFKWICTPSHRCVKICKANADCRSGETCEDAICRPPACGSDAQCNTAAGEECLGGSCKPALVAADVASCIVLPMTALLHEGSPKEFTIVARNAGGATVPYKGATTWSVDKASRASVAGDKIAGTATGGTETGAVKIQAKLGGTLACTDASAINYAAAAAGKTRVVVADLVTHMPVAGAVVVLAGKPNATTDANGIAEFDGADASKKTVSIFHHTYAYLTMVDATGTDLVAFVKPPPSAGQFTGTMTARDFDDLSDLKGTVHLSLYGGSIPGNLIDIQLSTLLGALVDTQLTLGSQKTTVPLPEGTVIGLGEQMFKTDYKVLAPAGIRTVWGLGGNADFSAITRALGPALSGGDTQNLNIGGIMSSLLPLLGKLQSGVLTGLEAKPDAPQAIGDKMKLDTLLRLRAEAQLPDMPSYTSGTEQKRFEGVIVLGGALYNPQGLVPLGLTAGIDAEGATDPNDPTKKLPDGKIDAADPGLPPGTLALRLSALHGGLESSKYVALALAASFSGLVGGSGGGSAPKEGLVLSGLVTFPGEIAYSATDAKKISFGSHFLSLPNPTLDGRSFDLGSVVDGAAFHRIDIGGEVTGEWSVYFPAGAAPASFSIPTPPAGFDDRFMKLETGKTALPKVIVQTVALSAGTSPLDYDGVLNFSGENMDDLTTRINAFSAREIVRPDAG